MKLAELAQFALKKKEKKIAKREKWPIFASVKVDTMQVGHDGHFI